MIKYSHSRAWISAALACICTSCAVPDAMSSNAYEDPGLIIFYLDTSSIVAPDTVSRGQPFAVAFRTFAGGCTRSVARTLVATSGLTTTIRPFNRTTASTGCTRDLLYLQHTAQVRVDASGTALLRVIGEQRGASTGATNGPVELSRSVVVR